MCNSSTALNLAVSKTTQINIITLKSISQLIKPTCSSLHLLSFLLLLLLCLLHFYTHFNLLTIVVALHQLELWCMLVQPHRLIQIINTIPINLPQALLLSRRFLLMTHNSTCLHLHLTEIALFSSIRSAWISIFNHRMIDQFSSPA